ncbi:MAG: hypothetical protein Q8R92_13035 [Deltaproteobacteria bacterium]|nr:hypothetical protein [Deltaproteobacteria bacterium]
MRYVQPVQLWRHPALGSARLGGESWLSKITGGAYQTDADVASAEGGPAVDIEFIREARREEFAWRGPSSTQGDRLSRRTEDVASLASQGKIGQAEHAFATAEDEAIANFPAGHPGQSEAQRLLARALDVLESYGGDVERSSGASTVQATAAIAEEAKAEAAAEAGSTSAAWLAEQGEREDVALAMEHGDAAYGISWLPGGNVAVEGAATAVEGIGDVWSMIPMWVKLAGAAGILGVGYVAVKR